MAADLQDIYRNLPADDFSSAPIVVESVCVNCEENGETRIMSTSIPYYNAVILISFECPHCGYKNNEIQSGEAVQEHGTLVVLRVQTPDDLRRLVVKSEYASIEVPELQLEIPHKSQPGEVTTVEGVLERVHRGLAQDQEKRRLLDPEGAAQIEAYLERIKNCMELRDNWTLRLRDPTGNCSIQNPDVHHADPRCIISHYHRSLTERKLLALADDSEEEGDAQIKKERPPFRDAASEATAKNCYLCINFLNINSPPSSEPPTPRHPTPRHPTPRNRQNRPNTGPTSTAGGAHQSNNTRQNDWSYQGNQYGGRQQQNQNVKNFRPNQGQQNFRQHRGPLQNPPRGNTPNFDVGDYVNHKPSGPATLLDFIGGGTSEKGAQLAAFAKSTGNTAKMIVTGGGTGGSRNYENRNSQKTVNQNRGSSENLKKFLNQSFHNDFPPLNSLPSHESSRKLKNMKNKKEKEYERTDPHDDADSDSSNDDELSTPKRSVEVETSPADTSVVEAPPQQQPPYRIAQTIGEGTFGEVLLVVSNKNPEMAIAMKKISAKNKNRDDIQKEIRIQKRLSQVGHDNVIRLNGMRNEEDYYFLFLEYADGGELFDKIEPGTGMSKELAQFYYRQLISGLKFIHDNDIVHRDIKPENLLLTATHVLKISNFGKAVMYRHEGVEQWCDVNCGTIPYAAPELVAGNKYSGPPADIWSTGIVLVAMLTGELPWEESSSAILACEELMNDNVLVWPWNDIDAQALCMLRKIVTDNIPKRATLTQIQEDSWFQHNYGRIETSNDRPLKRPRFNHESAQNFSNTQQSSSKANESTFLERQKIAFSLLTKPDDLLLTQHIELAQNTKNLNELQRMMVRNTRFCVNTDVYKASQLVAGASERLGYGVRTIADGCLLVTRYTSSGHRLSGREVSMMINLYTIECILSSPRVMVDFRRSTGDGIHFMKIYKELKEEVRSSAMCSYCDKWLVSAGYVPTNPQNV